MLGARIGRYEVVGRLAVGGLADVFLAREDGGRQVVIKRLLAERGGEAAYRERLETEGRIGLACDHPGLVRTLEASEHDGLAYVALELLPGTTLEEAVQRSGYPPAAAAVEIVRRLLAALHHLHGVRGEDGQPMGVVHRDVCPANVMLAPDGGVRLFDLGVAVETQRNGSYDPGLLAGRPAYTAPEAVRGRPLDARADLWSAAVVLHELLSRERLFLRSDPVRTLTAVAGELISPPSARRGEVDPALDAVVMRGLRRERVERWHDAATFEAALAALADGDGPDALVGWPARLSAGSPPDPRPGPPRR